MTNDPRLASLLEKAFKVAPAADANQVIEQVREEQSTELGEALSYEAVVPEANPVSWLAERLLPKLVYFLDSRGARLPSVGGLFVSLFVGDRLYFFEVEPLLELLSEWSGVPIAEMAPKWGANSA